MNSLSDKIKYTQDAIDAIQKVLEDYGIDMKNVALGKYAEIIKSLETSGDSSYNSTCIWFDSKYIPSVIQLPSIIYNNKELIYYNAKNIIISSVALPSVQKRDTILLNGTILDVDSCYKDYPSPILKEE